MRHDARERTIALKWTHYASQSVLEPHAGGYCVRKVRTVRCDVYTTPSFARESTLLVSEISEKYGKCTHHSCHPVDDHHDVEDDDHEVGHRFQPVLGPTDHATVCSALLNS